MSTRTSDEIRSEVAQSYGARVRPVLDADELSLTVVEPSSCCGPAPAASSCCTPSADSSNSCCGTDATTDDQVSRIASLYRDTNIADLPATVTDVAFGCGNPTAISALRPGETVLDLGSGGGIDCFLAAKMVGDGKVIGVDMTPEMIALANRNLAKVGATNVEFRHGQIENLPVDSNSVDVIISNCVINLSPDKDQVFREAFRVLRPGGRLQVSDIVWTKPVPQDIKDDMEKWAGCISGALEEQDYLAKIREAGFKDVVSVASEYQKGAGLASANVTAVKPA